jgi:hypothetical protein
VAAGQTDALDLRALRDGQVPDTFGHVLPLTAARGQVSWTVDGDENLVLIGRAEQADIEHAMSSSYACVNCCPASFADAWLDPDSVAGFIGDTRQFTFYELKENCFGNPLAPVSRPATWSSLDQLVATCNSTGLGTAQGPGSTHIQGRWTTFLWDLNPNNTCTRTTYNALADALCDVFTSLSLDPPTPSVVQEVGKSNHFLILKGTGDYKIKLTLSPFIDPTTVHPIWSGGSPGANEFERIVSSSVAGDQTITATVEARSVSQVIHIIAATTPPTAAVDAPKTYSYGGPITVLSGQFGRTAFSIGPEVAPPAYVVDPYFSQDRWVFRLRNVTHSYKQSVDGHGRIDLPSGNPNPFPLAPGLDLFQSHARARDDLDTSGLVNTGPIRTSYWVEFISRNHENEHVNRFYSSLFWLRHMDLFESDDVEATSVNVIFDCNDSSTTTGSAAVAKKKSGWDTAIAMRHEDADDAEAPNSEQAVHAITNPQYVPIRNAIPVP